MNWDQQVKNFDTEVKSEGFWTSINEILNEETSLVINVKKTTDGMIVSILPKSSSTDGALKNIAPLLIKGTAEELNKDFFALLQNVKSFAELSSDSVAYEKSLEKAKEEAAIAKAEKDKKKKVKEEIEKLVKEGDKFVEDKDADNLRKVINKIAGKDPKHKSIKTFEEKITDINGNTLF